MVSAVFIDLEDIESRLRIVLTMLPRRYADCEVESTKVHKVFSPLKSFFSRNSEAEVRPERLPQANFVLQMEQNARLDISMELGNVGTPAA